MPNNSPAKAICTGRGYAALSLILKHGIKLSRLRQSEKLTV